MPPPSIVSRIAHADADTVPAAQPSERPWWTSLQHEFHREVIGFELGLRDTLLVRTTAAADILLRTLGATAVGATALPSGYHPSRLRTVIRDQWIYTEAAETGDPTRFFATPPTGVRIRRTRPHGPHFRPRDGHCWDLEFESPYEPANRHERRDYLRHRQNRTAHARYWVHDRGPRPTLVAIHGFSADPYWLNEWFFSLPRFYKMGADVLLMTLPFHGQRRGLLAPFSGHGFFAGGIARMNEAFGQAVFDFRIFLDFLLRARRSPQVGVTGVSLGGYTSALLAGIEPRLAFAVPNVPVTSLADLVLQWQPMGSAIQGLMRLTHHEIEELRHLLAVHCPLTYRPVLERNRLMIIGGVGDRLAPPKHARLLWEHWDRPAIHWFPGSHLIHLDRGAYQREIKRFLDALDFFGPAEV